MKILKIFNVLILRKFLQNHENFDEILQNFEIRAAQNCENLVDLEKCCKMHKTEYLLAKIGVDTAENEPRKESCGRGDGSLEMEPRGAPPGGATRRRRDMLRTPRDWSSHYSTRHLRMD